MAPGPFCCVLWLFVDAVEHLVLSLSLSLSYVAQERQACKLFGAGIIAAPGFVDDMTAVGRSEHCSLLVFGSSENPGPAIPESSRLIFLIFRKSTKRFSQLGSLAWAFLL